jgi:soluble lytic murein transglycosylase-like protein
MRTWSGRIRDRGLSRPRAWTLLLLLAGLVPVAEAQAPPYQALIERVAARHGIDARLMTALVEVESGRRADAVSHKGAIGLAQLMPATARRFRVDPHDPEENLDGAARYLRWLLERYGGNTRLALAAYNAGEGAVDRYGGIPRYPETVAFVAKVLQRAGGIRSIDGPAADARPRLVRREDGSILITNHPGF